MAITKEIEIKVNTSGAVKNIDNLNNSVKSTKKEVDQSSEAISGLTGSIDKMTGGAITKLKGLTSSLGGVASGFKGIGAAIALSGLGLLLLTISAVVAAFKSSEEGQNKFAKIMGVIGSITGNLIDILSDFGELVISVFENPQKAIKDFANLIKENITNRLNGLLELIPNLGKAVKLLFEGNFSEAAKVAADATAKVTLGVDSISTSLQNATNKTKAFIAELEREAKIAGQIADDRAKADKTDRELIVKRAEADRKVAELREKALDRERFGTKERIGFLNEASKVEQEVTNKEIQSAILRRNAIIEENKLSKSNKEALKAEEEAKAAVINLETKRLNLQKALTAQISALKQQEKAENKAVFDERKKSIEDERKAKEEAIKKNIENEEKRLKAIEDLRKTYNQKLEDLEDVTQLQKIARQEERALSELEALNASELQKQELKEYYAKLTDEELEKVAQAARERKAAKQKEDDDKEIAGAKAVAEAKLDIQNSQLDNIASGIGILKQLSKKNKALQAASVIAENAVGVGKTIINTQAANAAVALKYAALPGGVALAAAERAANNISAGISIASSVLATKNALSQLGGGGSAQGGSLPSSGGGASAPSFNLVQGTGSNQIAESLTTERRPIQAYVVASNVTSAQELDRNSVSEATV